MTQFSEKSCESPLSLVGVPRTAHFQKKQRTVRQAKRGARHSPRRFRSRFRSRFRRSRAPRRRPRTAVARSVPVPGKLNQLDTNTRVPVPRFRVPVSLLGASTTSTRSRGPRQQKALYSRTNPTYSRTPGQGRSVTPRNSGQGRTSRTGTTSRARSRTLRRTTPSSREPTSRLRPTPSPSSREQQQSRRKAKASTIPFFDFGKKTLPKSYTRTHSRRDDERWLGPFLSLSLALSRGGHSSAEPAERRHDDVKNAPPCTPSSGRIFNLWLRREESEPQAARLLRGVRAHRPLLKPALFPKRGVSLSHRIECM